jgi:hypothetical protein
VGVVLAYGWIFSLLGFDLVSGLDPHWYSSLFGGYFFISALYAATVLWTLFLTLRDDVSGNILHDFGSLIVATSLLTTAMLYSQLLPLWYTNLEHEVRFLTVRMNLAPWSNISLMLLATVYLGPLIFLLPRRAKRTPWYLGLVSFILLFFLWIERLWLITPVFKPHRLEIGFVELSIALAFGASMGYLITTPKPPEQRGANQKG